MRPPIKAVHGVPITGSRPSVSRKPPFVPDAKDTSLDEEQFIKQAPMPFKDRNSVPQIPTADPLDYSTLGEPYGIASPVDAKTRSMGEHVGCDTTDETNWGATGDEKPKGYSPLTSGFPTGRRRK